MNSKEPGKVDVKETEEYEKEMAEYNDEIIDIIGNPTPSLPNDDECSSNLKIEEQNRTTQLGTGTVNDEMMDISDSQMRNENTKVQVHHLSNVLAPKNWSQIERLKSQRNKLQEKLLSKPWDSYNDLGKKDNCLPYNSGELETEEHFADKLEVELKSEEREKSFKSDSDDEESDKLFIDDEEDKDACHSQGSSDQETENEWHKAETSSCCMPKVRVIGSSKSVGDVSNQDLDLCELRVSNINNSLFEAIASIGDNSNPDTVSTEKNLSSCCVLPKPVSNKPISNKIRSKRMTPLETSDSSGTLDSGKDKKEYKICKSFSESQIISEEKQNKQTILKKKLKCFLEGKTKNEALENLLKKMKEKNHCLSSLTGTSSTEQITKPDTVDSPEVDNEKNYIPKTTVSNGNKNNPENKSESSDSDKECESGNESDEHDACTWSSIRPLLKHPSVIDLEKLRLEQQIENLKMQNEVIKMRALIQQKKSLSKYLASLKKKNEAEGKRNDDAGTSEDCTDSSLAMNAEKYTNDDGDDGEMVSSRCNEKIKNKDDKNDQILGKIKNSSTPAISINSSTDLLGHESVTVTKSPQLQSVAITASDSSLPGKNMRSILGKPLQQKEDAIPPKISDQKNIENSKSVTCIGIVNPQSNLFRSEENTLPSTNIMVQAKPTIPASMMGIHPNSKVPAIFQSRQDICLIQKETGQPVYALIDKTLPPVNYKISTGVLCLPINPGITCPGNNTRVNTVPAVAYSASRPWIQMGQVQVTKAGTKAILSAVPRYQNPQILNISTLISQPSVHITKTAVVTTASKLPVTCEMPLDKNGNKISKLNESQSVLSTDKQKDNINTDLGTSQSTDSHSDIQKTGLLLHSNGSKVPLEARQNMSERPSNQQIPNFISSSKTGAQDSIEAQIESTELQKLKNCPSKKRAYKEIATWKKADENDTASDKELKDQNTAKHVDKPASYTEKQIIIDSDSDESFDSIDMDLYDKAKNSKDTSYGVFPKVYDPHNVNTNKTSAFEGNKLIDTQVSSASQQSHAGKKFMKTKFIILKGDICDKWLEVKRRSGFGNMPDPNFVHYLLKIVEMRQRKDKVYAQKLMDVAECDKNNNSIAKEPLDIEQDKQNIVIQHAVSQTNSHGEDMKVSNAQSNSPKQPERKCPIKRPAEKTMNSERRHSEPKKSKYDSMASGMNNEKGRYNFLSKSAQKQMKWAVTVFREWLKSQGELDLHFEYQGTLWLNMMLERFYMEACTMDNGTYSANNLQNIRRSLSVYLEGHPGSNCVNISIPLDPGFISSNQALAEIMKKPRATPSFDNEAMSPADIEKMYTSEALSDKTPQCLIRKVWFDIVYHLCSGQFSEYFLKSLKKHSLALQSDVNGVYYSFNDDVCVPPDEPLAKMYATPDKPERCPVRTTTVYLSKLCGSCDALFQCPNVKWQYGVRWYMPMPLTMEKINKIITRVSLDAKLSRLYKIRNVFATAQKQKNSQ